LSELFPNITYQTIAEIFSGSVIEMMQNEVINASINELRNDKTEKITFEELTAKMEITSSLVFSVYLTIDRKAASIVSQILFGMELDNDSDIDLYNECVKELLNIVIGTSLPQFSDLGLELDMSLPEFVESKSFIIKENHFTMANKDFSVGDGLIKIIITDSQ